MEQAFDAMILDEVKHSIVALYGVYVGRKWPDEATKALKAANLVLARRFGLKVKYVHCERIEFVRLADF